MHRRLFSPSFARIQQRSSFMNISMAPCSSSSVKTFQHQKDLPLLPVPDLKESCELYLKTLIPLAQSSEEYEHSKAAVESFLQNEGPVLQQRLLEHAKNMNAQGKSWLEDWWLDMAYLTFRLGLPTNSNYYLLFNEQERFSQLEKAAHIIRGALEFKSILENEELPPDYLRKTQPQCMEQYRRIYWTTRVGKPERDDLLVFNGSKHAVVICKGQFFTLQVLNDNGEMYHFDEYKKRLEEISSEAERRAKEGSVPPIGVITTIHRDDSCRIRSLLNKENESQMNIIDTALFAVTLDHDSPSDIHQAGEWLNGGNRNTAQNRWFEKLMNFVVFKNGIAGMSGEHAPLDAPIVGIATNHFINKWEKGTETKEGASNIPNYQPIQWNIDSTLSKELEVAEKQAADDLTNCEIQIVRNKDYGADWIKRVAKTSPDAYTQMSIQLAYYYTQNDSSATYETGTARGFYHGRTDTVRTFSADSKKWTEAMKNSSVSSEEKLQLLQTALNSHSAYMKRAVDGKVIDRHFLGLRLVKEPNEKMPDIFTDPLWRQSTRFRVSTSNMSSPFFIAGFGPTEPDGFGICYNTRPDELIYSVSSFRSCSITSAKSFADNLYKALSDMRGLYKETSRL
mmetsp:Transcript_16413/g.27990  ORF Transcript_16413/g.27990 Transcript_16413/m.27990 type:complete len:622 (-) Transcript_16413:7-1872(-)